VGTKKVVFKTPPRGEKKKKKKRQKWFVGWPPPPPPPPGKICFGKTNKNLGGTPRWGEKFEKKGENPHPPRGPQPGCRAPPPPVKIPLPKAKRGHFSGMCTGQGVRATLTL